MVRRVVSIKDVAKQAGVSTATVSNVFNGTKPVSADLAKRVREAAEELRYEVNRAASHLRSGRTRVVTILVPDLSDPFFISIITEVESLARLSGYEIIVGNSADDADIEESRLNALMAWQPAGMIVVPCTDTIPARLVANKNEIPFVLVDRVGDATIADSIVIDNEDGGAIAAKHLSEIGHRDVLMVASDMGLLPIRQRISGAQKEIKQFGGVARLVEVGPEPTQASKTLECWMARNRLPTAIFALTTMTTLATLTCLAKRRMQIPENVSLVGFDDYPWMRARRTALTAVGQPSVEISRAAWDRLTVRMDGEQGEPRATVLTCTLEIRDSTLPIEVPDSLENATDGGGRGKVRRRRNGIQPAVGKDGTGVEKRGRKRPGQGGSRKTKRTPAFRVSE
ncbi:MAG: LacI family transcriptional regulator [Hyphomicrobiales bacterium]|nr:LacI family transcriptional regulator [Hyphomicrobiales bacterium]